MFKVIYENVVIDTIKDLQFVYQNPNNMGLLFSKNKNNAMGIISSDGSEIWHLDELKPFYVGDHKTVSLVEIDELEYNTLTDSLNEGKIIVEQNDSSTQEENVELEQNANVQCTTTIVDLLKKLNRINTQIEENTQTVDSISIQDKKNAKKDEINSDCETEIYKGVQVILSDGNKHYFTLKPEDQTAMLFIYSQVMNGNNNIPWHENNINGETQPCVFLSNADALTLITAAQNHITYQQTYCNSLKRWIDSIQTEDELDSIKYGIAIPYKYKSEVLRTLDYA